MLGLLIKDIKLIKNNGLKTLLIIGGMGLLLMTTSMLDEYMLVSYISVVGLIYTLNSMSFDAYENGYAFMFTLPINAKIYVMEKYLFSVLLTFAACVLSGVVVGIYNGGIADTGHWISCISIGMSMLWVMVLSIPAILKFGVEKGRIVIFALVMGVIVCAYLFSLVSRDSLMEFMLNITEYVEDMKTGEFVLAGIMATISALLISMGVSIFVMSRKDF